jgi:hypothetical protein
MPCKEREPQNTGNRDKKNGIVKIMIAVTLK